MIRQTGIAKDQYKLFKDQVNVINNNREYDVEAEDNIKTENGVKAKDGEINDLSYRYMGDKYKDLINNVFNYGLN